ncbi:hypothetical protein HY837_00330 [archaeon]|nr:hypothetical protein [archaeon]
MKKLILLLFILIVGCATGYQTAENKIVCDNSKINELFNSAFDWILDNALLVARAGDCSEIVYFWFNEMGGVDKIKDKCVEYLKEKCQNANELSSEEICQKRSEEKKESWLNYCNETKVCCTCYKQRDEKTFSVQVLTQGVSSEAECDVLCGKHKFEDEVLIPKVTPKDESGSCNVKCPEKYHLEMYKDVLSQVGYACCLSEFDYDAWQGKCVYFNRCKENQELNEKKECVCKPGFYKDEITGKCVSRSDTETICCSCTTEKKNIVFSELMPKYACVYELCLGIGEKIKVDPIYIDVLPINAEACQIDLCPISVEEVKELLR